MQAVPEQQVTNIRKFEQIGGEAGDIAREFDQRVLKATAGAEKRPMRLARETNGAVSVTSTREPVSISYRAGRPSKVPVTCGICS